MNIITNQNLDRPSHNHIYKEVKRCPHCESVFIDDTSCETCGIQFNVDLLGGPLGDKCFYTLREKYWEGIPKFKISKKLETPHSKKYRVSLQSRYNILLDYLYECQTKKEDILPVYFVEFKDLIVEMVQYDLMDDLLKSIDDGKFVTEISEIISRHESREEVEVSHFSFFLNKRILGIIKIKNIIYLSLFSTLLTISALLFMKNLLISSSIL